MKPQRVMRQLNCNPNYKTHADNIAQIIATAENIAEADLRVGYYMMVVGVTYDKPKYEEAHIFDRPADWVPPSPRQGRIEDVTVLPVALDPAAVKAVFSASEPTPQPMLPGYDF
jgi:hypothetical protein